MPNGTDTGPSPTYSGGQSDGLYVGVSYHYLHGFRYEDFDLGLRLDTDENGLLRSNPAGAAPIIIGRDTTGSGRGFAVDIGTSAVVGPWEVGLAVTGVANRLVWSDVDRTEFTQSSLLSGGEFVERPTVRAADVRTELPVDLRANFRYNTDMWSAVAEAGRGFNGTSFRGGFEQRLGAIALRGGARYIREQFEPTGGVGFNFGEKIGLDVAAFSTSANIERQRKLAIAVSLRIMRGEN